MDDAEAKTIMYWPSALPGTEKEIVAKELLDDTDDSRSWDGNTSEHRTSDSESYSRDSVTTDGEREVCSHRYCENWADQCEKHE